MDCISEPEKGMHHQGSPLEILIVLKSLLIFYFILVVSQTSDIKGDNNGHTSAVTAPVVKQGKLIDLVQLVDLMHCGDFIASTCIILS